MTREDELELHRLCDLLRRSAKSLQAEPDLVEAISKAGFGLSLAFMHGFRPKIEDLAQGVGRPLTEAQENHLRSLGVKSGDTPPTGRLPTSQSLLEFVGRHRGRGFTTLGRKVSFSAAVVQGALCITPHSSGKVRRLHDEVLEKVCAEFSRTRSLRPADYHDITFDSSYLVALIQAFQIESLK